MTNKKYKYVNKIVRKKNVLTIVAYILILIICIVGAFASNIIYINILCAVGSFAGVANIIRCFEEKKVRVNVTDKDKMFD